MHTKKWILLLSAITCLQVGVSAQPFDAGEYGHYLRRGYTAVLSEPKVDTHIVVDPVTGEEIQKTQISSGSPDKINGKKIYYSFEVTSKPTHNVGALSLDEYIMSNIKRDIEKLDLPDGVLQVNFSRIIVDEKGKVVYYEYNGLKHWIPREATRTVNDEKIAPKIHKLMASAPAMKPATLNGKNVGAYLASGSLYDFKMEVKTRSKK